MSRRAFQSHWTLYAYSFQMHLLAKVQSSNFKAQKFYQCIRGWSAAKQTDHINPINERPLLIYKGSVGGGGVLPLSGVPSSYDWCAYKLN